MAEAGAKTRLTGGCQCGAVRYVLMTAPEESSICHCRMCQKASGQPFAPVRLENLHWTRGEPTIFRSSNFAERGFCEACGTPLSYRIFESDSISVIACSLDDPRVATPTAQYGIESELPWSASLNTLPRHRTDEWLTPEQAARFVSHQHPDRDT
jgi:hypothetical protein